MVTLAIRYLNGWVMATHPTNREVPEWPPHPDRVFMAMAAAHFETDGDASERQILEWLEALGPPAVNCSGTDHRATVTTYVPVNDEKSPIKKGKALMESPSMPIGRDRQARQFPLTIPHNDIVRMTWVAVDPPIGHFETLEQLCTKVTNIGHSASLVQMWVDCDNENAAIRDSSPGSGSQLDADKEISNRKFVSITLVPQSIGRFRLRVPGPGRLADLERRFNRENVDAYSALQLQLTTDGLKPAEKKRLQLEIRNRFGDRPPETQRPEPALWSGYDSPDDDTTASAAVASHFSNLIVLQHVGGRRLGLESTLQLTQALRNVVMKYSGLQPVPDWLSGHQSDGRPAEREYGHTAFIPLPHVGRKHADGHLLGMAIVPPRDVTRSALANVLHNVLYDHTGDAVERQLVLGALGTCCLAITDGSESQAALDPATWTHPSRRWGTVTPIALDRHAKGERPWDEIVSMIVAACERIGLPRPQDVIPTPVSMFIGAPSGADMPRIQRKNGAGQIRHTHAILTFEQEVTGPVLVGAGRYRGYGLCRPLDADLG